MSTAPLARSAPTAAFRHPQFVLFQVARFLGILGWAMTATAIGQQVYDLTRRELDLGYVGLAMFVPAFLMSPFTGYVADRFDRRWVLIMCMLAFLAANVALVLIAWQGQAAKLSHIFITLVFNGAFHAFFSPASQSLMPQTVPPEDFQNAVAWNSSIWQVTAILGPATGGVLYAWRGGPAIVYLLDIAFMVVATGLYLVLRPRPARREVRAAGLAVVAAGLRYVWERKIILGAISMDLFAVLLGGAVALMPIFANDVLGVGRMGTGLLRSAPAVGAGLTALALAWAPPMRRSGRALFIAVTAFGLATIGFGLSKNFILSCACLATLGAADMVSVYIRHTLVQLMTPEEMRGRVSAVNLVFIGASNELGEFESGVTAHWLGPVGAVVAGGVGTLVIVGLWAKLFPQLRNFGALNEALLPAEEKTPAARVEATLAEQEQRTEG